MDRSSGENRIRVLLVGEQGEDLALIREAFASMGWPIGLAVADTLHAARGSLSEVAPLFIIVNSRVLGVDFLSQHTHVPVLVISDNEDVREAIEMTNAGACNYIVKTRAILSTLPGIVLHEMDKWQRRRQSIRHPEVRERLASIADLDAHLVAIAGHDGIFSYINPAGRRLLALSDGEDVSNYRIHQFFPGWKIGMLTDENLPSPVADIAWNDDSQMKTRDGCIATVSLAVVAHMTRESRIDYFTVLATSCNGSVDLERKLSAVETRLQQTHKLETVGHMAARIAHDLNNTLTAVIGYNELALEALPANSDSARHLAVSHKASHCAKELVAQLMAISAGKEMTARSVDVRQLVDDTLKMVRTSASSNIDIVQDIDVDAGNIVVFPSEIQQVLLNLCLNGIHAMKDTGGTLEVILKRVDIERSLDTSTLSPGNYVQITVRDSGTGMEEGVRERIFEPFFTTRPAGEGSGLGLSVAKRVARKHGGDINVESVLGNGAAFRLYLPATEASVGIA